MQAALAKQERFSSSATTNGEWWKTAVFYEIYPRSFQDTNADGIGDLRGITEHLDYLKDLGIDALWISPFYKSPMADFGYDVSDYQAVDPIFGEMADFEELLAKAKALSLKVIVDFVPNHTSDEHPWFIESRSSKTNPKRDWYLWRDGKEGGLPNNWPTFFGGSVWTWDETSEQYYLHLFLDRQPDLNWRNPEVIEAMHAAMRFWLDKGVDGFRLDAINFLIKHPDLPDLPSLSTATAADLVSQHIYTNNQPELHTVLKGFRQVLDSYSGNRVLIGETGTLSPHELSEFYGQDHDEIQLPMIFLPFHTKWEAKSMRDCLVSFYEGLPKGATLHFVFDNHDDRRMIDRYGYENHRSIAMLLLTVLGSPILYYGDEIAMIEGIIPADKKQDPFDIKLNEHSLGRDPVRTPMQWTPEVNAGFCEASAEPWLPINPDYLSNNVAAQAQDPNSTLNFYRTLLNFRKTSNALQFGNIQFLDTPSDSVLAYLRESEEECLLIAINFGENSQNLDISSIAETATYVLSSRMQSSEISSLAVITLHPHESILLRLD